MELLAHLYHASAYESWLDCNCAVLHVSQAVLNQCLPFNHAGKNLEPERLGCWTSIVAAIAASVVSGVPAIAAYVNTNGDVLNVRSSPNGQIVGTLANGTSVALTGRNVDGWLELSNGRYVSAQWVASGEPPRSTSGTPSAPTAPRAFGIVQTNGSPVNIRNSPNGAIALTLRNGTRIALTGRNANGWLEITNGKFVSANWVVVPQATTAPVGSDVSIGYVATNGSPLNVRRSPDGAVVGILPNGSRIELTGQTSNGWLRLRDGYYVSANWVRR